MDLTTYEYLTGIEVTSGEETFVVAQIRRTQRILESMLGYTLDPNLVNQNLYNEQGKTHYECPCPNIDLENLELEAPDKVVNAYRLFPYNSRDKYLHIDPFYQVHAVKLVKDGITYRTLEPEEYRIEYKQGWGKFIEICECPFDCDVDCDCVQLAVDADWLWACDSSLSDLTIGECIDEALLYIWADMVTYYADCKKNVKSESMLSHSYTKYDNLKPEEANSKYLNKLAGPNGSLAKVIVL